MKHSPRPLPLFLELLRQAGRDDPILARSALRGLDAYAAAPRTERAPPSAEVARIEGTCLRTMAASDGRWCWCRR